jgi:phosphatidylglycerophosphatase C
MKKEKVLALFDFDGTITDRDTFFDFFVFIYGYRHIAFIFFFLSPFTALHLAGLISGHRLKEMFLKKLIKGWSREDFALNAENYFNERLHKIVRASALEKIKKHLDNGDETLIVSASPAEWILPFAKHYKLGLIATELEIIDNRYTGKIKGLNCKGMEKVKRIKKKYDISNFTTISAYGDSSGDKEMLELATNGYYRVFK